MFVLAWVSVLGSLPSIVQHADRRGIAADLMGKALAGLVEPLTRGQGTPLDVGDYSALHALTAGLAKDH